MQLCYGIDGLPVAPGAAPPLTLTMSSGAVTSN
jgi:hypothetical protein